MPGHDEARAEQAVDGLGGRHDVALAVGRGEMRGVGAFLGEQARCPAPGAAEVDVGAALVGIGLGGDALDRHVDEGRIAARLGAVGEGDLQHLGQQMQRVHGAEAQALDVVAFEDVQHLGDVHARCRGRRRADDLPIAIAAADRRALDDAIVGEVLFGDEAAGLLHALDQQVAERAAMQRALALLGDQSQRLAIVGLHQARAGLQRRAIGQQAGGRQLVRQKLGGGALDAVGQVGRDREAAGGMADRGLHDVGERHRAVAAQGQGPGQQRARRGDRLRPDLVLAALDVVDLRRGAGRPGGTCPDGQPAAPRSCRR